MSRFMYMKIVHFFRSLFIESQTLNFHFRMNQFWYNKDTLKPKIKCQNHHSKPTKRKNDEKKALQKLCYHYFVHSTFRSFVLNVIFIINVPMCVMLQRLSLIIIIWCIVKFRTLLICFHVFAIAADFTKHTIC